MKNLFFIFCLIFIFSCGNDEKENTEKTTSPAKKDTAINEISTAISLKDVYFMEGTWIDSSGEMDGFHEKWVKQGDTLMEIVGFYADGKDTAIMEVIKVKMINQLLHYVPKVEGQNNGEEVLFAIEPGSSSDSLVFANYNHDFPREITYVKRDENNVDVYLRGVNEDQSPKQFMLSLKRMEKQL